MNKLLITYSIIATFCIGYLLYNNPPSRDNRSAIETEKHIRAEKSVDRRIKQSVGNLMMKMGQDSQKGRYK